MQARSSVPELAAGARTQRPYAQSIESPIRLQEVFGVKLGNCETIASRLGFVRSPMTRSIPDASRAMRVPHVARPTRVAVFQEISLMFLTATQRTGAGRTLDCLPAHRPDCLPHRPDVNPRSTTPATSRAFDATIRSHRSPQKAESSGHPAARSRGIHAGS